jgi:hypothetical protein
MAAIALSLAGTGCFIPRPESYQRIPEMHGVVLDGGSPVQNASVWWSENYVCSEPRHGVVHSDDAGAFRIPGLRKFRLGVVVSGGDPGMTWSLCILPTGSSSVLRWTHFMLGWQSPQAMELYCDVRDTDVCMIISMVQGRTSRSTRRAEAART